MKALLAGLLFLVALTLSGGALAQDKDKVILKVQDKIAATDQKDKVRKDCYHKVHVVKLMEGVTYRIDMLGDSEFDTYLRLEDDAGKQLAEDDDSGEGLNARIVFPAPKTGTYRIIATTYDDNDTGSYTLLVTAIGGEKK